MGDMQVKLVPAGGALATDAISLDNGDWRRIQDSYGISTGGDGLKAFAVSFTVEGATVTELQTNWKATVEAFTLRDCHLYATIDDSIASGSGQWLEAIIPWDGKHGHTQSFVTLNEAHAQSATCLYATLWLKTENMVGASGNGTAGVDGLDDASFQLTISYNAGREVGRSLIMRWLPTATATNGLAAYTANRGTMLTTYMKTAATGARDATSGLALTVENIEYDNPGGDTVRVSLMSTAIATSLLDHAAIRSFDCTITQEVPESFGSGGGLTPTIYNCNAALDVSKDIYSGAMHQFFEDQVKQDFEAYVKAETGEGTIVALSGPTVTSNLRTGKITIQAIYQGQNSTVISYMEKRSSTELADYTRNRDSQGYDGLQRPVGAVPKFVTMQVTRIALDDTVPSLSPPSEAGFVYIEAGKDEEIVGPNNTPFGNGVYVVTAVARFERVRLRSGSTGGSGPLIPSPGGG